MLLSDRSNRPIGPTFPLLEVEQNVIAEASVAGMSEVWEGGYKKVVKGSPPKTLVKDII